MTWFRVTLLSLGMIAVSLPAILMVPCVIAGECGFGAAYAEGNPVRLLALGGLALLAVGVSEIGLAAFERVRR